MDFLEPQCIINVHSHDPEYVYGRHQDVILYHPSGIQQSPLTQAVYETLKLHQIKVSFEPYLKTNDQDLCSPMILQNLLNYYPLSSADGFYISIDSSKLLFEADWSK
jgi:hypothetical protein